MSGKVYLVGAGPGDPELLTMKAARILRSADVVLHDALVSEAILQMVRPHAQLIDVGKRMGQKRLTQDAINQLLIEVAGCTNTVVRLKGGDPLMFGRAAEEMAALRQHGIEFEIVPGITAAVAAAAEARIPLTDRDSSAGVVFLTAQQAAGKDQTSVGRFVAQDATLAIYMPGAHYREIANAVIEAGKSPQTPCLIVSNASRDNQDFLWTDLAALRNIGPPEAPALLIIGEVARCRDESFAIPLLQTVQQAAGATR
jgi:uroporphyrin-III C-methyltransferase